MSKNKVLIFLLFADGDDFIERKKQSLYIVVLPDNEFPSDAAMGLARVRICLLGEEIPVDGSVDDGKDIIFVAFFSGNLVYIANEGDISIEVLEVNCFINLDLFLEIIGQFQQRNIVVILLGHELD